ncbi:type I polyketide synthase [Polyangium fumosum]|uniref:Acyltransferase domain-containing protein n=1 Tax=Polyangium fumosum TaxID=889272 RepID=A0A4U1IQ91_9BACT|nr:type I polyketide synthase [Polyangium fumosum]TKC96365.1 acyltransferase domain-containing protein [Polyangium fumosum]
MRWIRERRDPGVPSRSLPIAIIGLACRLPKGPSADAFWQTLCRGEDAITETPSARWSADAFYHADVHAPGKMNTRWGGFLEQVDQFDPLFFGISPREASEMDPQQRLMLELSWEALEDAGVPVDALTATQTGVFFGAMWSDYARIAGGRPDAILQHTATGQDLSIIPARISYSLGLRGPSIAVSTASSSSLVAVHMACQSLSSGESTLALAGGVNLILAPESTIAMSKLGTMARDGRSKAFDARADGYVRGEGGGVVVLKPLSLALADGDPIYCVIRGSAVNNNGFGDGLLAPSVEAQEALLREAYARAGVNPADVCYVEAHGTGTALGDRIEASALGAVLGAGRPAERPLRIGSAKTNIGHLESAAGVAGLIKAALALKHRFIPPNLHFSEPNPDIPFGKLRLKVQDAVEAWPAVGDAPALAGVSSFGFGGTNCHVVLEGVPARRTGEVQGDVACAAAADEPRAELLVLSARSEAALSARAGDLSSWLVERPDLAISDLCCTAGLRRTHHEHRLAVIGGTREEMHATLSAAARGEWHAGVVRGKVEPGGMPGVVFVFPGQGSQWAGMGRALLAEESVFRRVMEECDALMRPHAGFSVIEEILAPEAASRLGETAVAQPALFAIEVALAALFASWGVRPDAVIGHSVGEVAAAHVAGALELAEAVRLVCCRGRVMQHATGRGKMAAVEMTAGAAAEMLSRYEGRLAIGAVNDPGSVVLSGETAALSQALARLSGEGLRCQELRVDYAFHSPQMDPLREEFVRALRAVSVQSTAGTMYSTVTGERVPGDALDAAYWGRNIREPVKLADAMRTAIRDGHRLFLEVGPHPVLAAHLERCLAAERVQGQVLFSIRRGQEARRHLLRVMGALYTRGAAVDLAPLYPDSAKCVALPAYPWQRRSYWIAAAAWRDGAGEPSSDAYVGNEHERRDKPQRSASSLRQTFHAAAPGDRRRLLEEFLSAQLAEVLQLESAHIDPLLPLGKLGLDSLMAMIMRNRIEATLGIAVPTMLVLQKGDVRRISSYLLEQLTSESLVSAVRDTVGESSTGEEWEIVTV